MENYYSWDWAQGVYNRLVEKYARATNLLGQGFMKNSAPVVHLLQTNDNRWPLFRDFMRILDKWICNMPIEYRGSTTRMLPYIRLAAATTAKNRPYTAKELLTAFGIELILGEQPFRMGLDPASPRVAEAMQPRIKEELDPLQIEEDGGLQNVFDFFGVPGSATGIPESCSKG